MLRFRLKYSFIIMYAPETCFITEKVVVPADGAEDAGENVLF